MKSLLIALLLLIPLVPIVGAAPGACPEESVTIGTYERHTVTVHEDCRVEVVMNEGIICLGGGVGREDTQVGDVHVTRYYCTWPGPTPVEIAGQDVFLPETMGCTWKGSYKPLVATPIVTVWFYSCDSPDT